MTKRKKFLLAVLLLLLLLGGYELACRRAVQVTKIIEGTQTGEFAQWRESLAGEGVFLKSKDANTTWLYAGVGVGDYVLTTIHGKASLVWGTLDIQLGHVWAPDEGIPATLMAVLKHPPVERVRASMDTRYDVLDRVIDENPTPYWERAGLPEPPSRFFQWFSYVLGTAQ